MEQILLAYGIPKETVAAITILYRNTKVKVRSPDGDTEYFDIVAGVLQGDTLAPYLFIICLDYVLRTSIDKIKENGISVIKTFWEGFHVWNLWIGNENFNPRDGILGALMGLSKNLAHWWFVWIMRIYFFDIYEVGGIDIFGAGRIRPVFFFCCRSCWYELLDLSWSMFIENGLAEEAE